tara:strand:- start:156 stop:437 length:282 start_codon:yes stop_codon:yes gene_type:complete
MNRFKRPAQVGKIDTFSFDDAKWLNGETIASFTVDQVGDFVNVIATAFEGSIITARVEGLIVGNAELHYQVTSNLGRSHCIDASIVVLSACSS